MTITVEDIFSDEANGHEVYRFVAHPDGTCQVYTRPGVLSPAVMIEGRAVTSTNNRTTMEVVR